MRVPVSLGVYGQGGVDGSGWSLWGGMRLGFQSPRVIAVDGIVGFSVTSLSISLHLFPFCVFILEMSHFIFHLQ